MASTNAGSARTVQVPDGVLRGFIVISKDGKVLSRRLNWVEAEESEAFVHSAATLREGGVWEAEAVLVKSAYYQPGERIGKHKGEDSFTVAFDNPMSLTDFMKEHSP
jgi:hypothetical protein